MSFGLARLGPLLAGFSAAFPEVELDVVLNDRRVDLVEEGFDVALRLAASLEDSSLVVRAIGSGDRYVCGAPAYLARRGVPRRPEDLATHACLRYALHDPPDRWSFEREGEHVSVRVSGAVLMNNSQALRDVAIAGAGLLLAPDFAVADALADGRLVRVLHEWLPSGYRVFGVSPPARYGSLKTRAFVDFVARALATPKSPRLPS
jgi:DNA-binding transcriptional LysR family regulator